MKIKIDRSDALKANSETVNSISRPGKSKNGAVMTSSDKKRLEEIRVLHTGRCPESSEVLYLLDLVERLTAPPEVTLRSPRHAQGHTVCFVCGYNGPSPHQCELGALKVTNLRLLETIEQGKALREADEKERKRLREALEYTEGNIGCILDGTQQERWQEKVRAALKGEK